LGVHFTHPLFIYYKKKRLFTFIKVNSLNQSS
jgi:hypothetical protein